MLLKPIDIEWSDEKGEERVTPLPSKYVVCGRCEGHGCHLREAIAEHAYTSEEFEEAFPDAESRSAYFTRGGMYDIRCETCKGDRVVIVVDRKACTTDEQRAALAAHLKQQRAEREIEAMWAAEIRHGA